MNKKILILSIMMLLINILAVTSVNAATITSATVTITPSKTEVKAGDTVEFTISLKELNASDGILGFGAYINYDSNLLTLNTTAKGLSNWSDATISENTNRFVTTKDTHSSNNEDILKITFTVKEAIQDIDTAVSLQKIEISNGTQYNISEVSSNKITIKASTTENPPVDQNTENNNGQDNENPSGGNSEGNNNQNNNGNNNGNNNNNNSNNNNNKPDSNGENSNNSSNNKNNSENGDGSTNKIFPALGANSYLITIITILAVVAIISIFRINLLNRKIKEQNQDFSDKDE